MNELRPPLARRALPFVVAVAFLVTATIAAWRIVALRDIALDRELDRIQSFVEDQVSAWEDALLADLNDQVGAIAMTPEQAPLRQARLRKTRPWFNSLYVWRVRDPSREGEEVLFPFPATVENREFIESRPCIRRAFATMREVPLDPIRVAQAYSFGCRNEGPVVRSFAASESAYTLRSIGRLDDGLAALDMARIPEGVTLLEAAKQGMPPGMLVVLRFARAELLVQLGRQDEALDRLAELGEQIADLDAPDLAHPLSFLHGERGILGVLRRQGRHEQAARLKGLTERAERRLVASSEVFGQIVPLVPDIDAEPKFIYDQYSDTPFLLYFGWSEDRGVALQLEQQALLANFLHRRMRAYRQQVTITDASGEWVAGARKGGSYAASVPFSRTLTHLRVGVRQSAVDEAMSSTSEQWIVPFVIIAVCAVLVILVQAAQVRLTWRQYELLNRQRAFTTRVTHELKTPLAGIRVMAENLEAGAFRTDDQRRDMAQRIIEEADRLKSRVDEVLAVAREHTIPSPEPVDPEEVVLHAIDLWGPRYETSGVVLHADLHATEQILGDGAALRDAVSCLLDNAMKYRDEERDDPQVWIELSEEGRFVLISVADNGLGVPKGMRRSIFQRFVRVEGPNRGKAGGHGLGLDQVRQIVDAHKGSIQCVDGVDGGACFVMRLPALRTD